MGTELTFTDKQAITNVMAKLVQLTPDGRASVEKGNPATIGTMRGIRFGHVLFVSDDFMMYVQDVQEEVDELLKADTTRRIDAQAAMDVKVDMRHTWAELMIALGIEDTTANWDEWYTYYIAAISDNLRLLAIRNIGN